MLALCEDSRACCLHSVQNSSKQNVPIVLKQYCKLWLFSLQQIINCHISQFLWFCKLLVEVKWKAFLKFQA